MATFTISSAPWPTGTSVSVYPAEAWVEPTSAPSGAVAATGTVSSVSTVQFTGLADNRRYVAYALGTGVKFATFAKPAETVDTRLSSLEDDRLNLPVNARDYGIDFTGSTDSATALNAAIAQAQALSQAGYANSKGYPVEVPAGRILLRSRVVVPDSVWLRGVGPRATSFLIDSGFNDNVVFCGSEDGNQEWLNVSGFSLFGQDVAQPNGGAATTVTATTFTPVPTRPVTFTLAVASTAGYAATGTLNVGTARVAYNGISGNTFTGCILLSAPYVAIPNGAAVTPVTTFNIQGVRVNTAYANSWLRDLWISNMSAEGLYVGQDTNCVDFHNLVVNFSGRDGILVNGAPQVQNWSKITPQYVGRLNSGTFAAMHIRGDAAAAYTHGNISIKGLYSELDQTNQTALWLENVGGIDADNIALMGGGANYTGQATVRIDSTQANPTTQDWQHSAGISLRNISASQIAAGRHVLIDNVRGVDSGTGASAPSQITRYDTEDTANITVEREHRVFGGTITSWRSTFDPRIPFASVSTTSGTQVGAPIPAMAGESYGHALFYTSTTAATFGTNADGHWYVAIYDDSGNLMTQTADQGTAAMAASSVFRLALNAAIKPTKDALYTAVVMIYVGTGGAPAAPTLKGAGGVQLATLVTGMKPAAVTANAGQTTGTAPGTLGSTGSPNGIPFIMLYT